MEALKQDNLRGGVGWGARGGGCGWRFYFLSTAVRTMYAK